MISLDFQNLDQNDIQSLERCIDEGCSTASPLVDEFEAVAKDFLGLQGLDLIATNSGTSALHLALIDAGVEPGNKVVLPVLTFVSTVNVIKYVGAIPVFADVDSDTWCITPKSIWDSGIFSYKFIMPVDLYGNLVFKWGEKARVILDSAESFGARFDFEYCDYACFSFNGNKIMTTGGGGVLIGKILGRAKNLSTQAKDGEGGYFDVGYNYRMAGLSAALGLSQIKKIPYFLERKRRINQIYRSELSDYLKLQLRSSGEPSWWFTSVLWPEKFDIVKVQKRLADANIPTRRVFKPLNMNRIFWDGKRYPNAERIYEHGLCLPSGTKMADEDVYRVCSIIKKLYFGG